MRLALLAGVVVSTVAAATAVAQTGMIAGRVINAATREPVEGVLIGVPGTAYTTQTRENGSYTLIGVPPGTHTVVARRLGFATRELTAVEVRLGTTRVLDIEMQPSAVDRIDRSAAPPEAERPLAGRALSLTSDQVLALPGLGLSSALGVNGGYATLPATSATLALADLRRGITTLQSVRGARAEATHYLVDGVDATNPVFGTPALLVEPMTAMSVGFSPAHVDAEHGAALSGLVNQALRVGGDGPSGALEFQTSAVAGTFGAAATDASGASAIRGYVAGRFPLFGRSVGYSVGGHLRGERATVLEYANGDVRGSADNENAQLVLKLTHALRPTVVASLVTIAQRRTAIGVDVGFLEGDSVAPATLRNDTRLIVGRLEKRFDRASISVSLGGNRVARETCSIWQGVCVEGRFQRIPQGDEIPAFGPPPRETPYALSGQYFGGEDYTTRVVRADVVLQASDRNQLRAGVYSAQHDITYRDAMGHRWLQGVVLTVPDAYRVKPVEFAAYIQDAIEHDLLTVRVGVRFDYGRNGTRAFTNPMNPYNGTTAREVCDGTAPGLSETPFVWQDLSGIAACVASPVDDSGRPFLLDSAARLAQTDDFKDVGSQAAFSPRIGLSLPVTETSAMFLNIGRFTRYPLYHDAFRHTGVGTRAGLDGDGDGICELRFAMPDTNECAPNVRLAPALPEFLGSPDLSMSSAGAWEAGFASRLGAVHAIEASVFSNSQSFLPSVYTDTLSPDIGLTYGVVPQGGVIRVARPRGYVNTLGFSLSVRRRLEGVLSYSVTYAWQRSSERGARPDLIAEDLVAGGTFNNNVERATKRSRPHMVNARLGLRWRDRTPEKLGRVGGVLLQQSQTVVTLAAASGSESRSAAQFEFSPLARRVSGTGALVNLLYARWLPLAHPQVAVMVRVQNLLDAEDGSADLVRLASLRGAPAQTGGVPIERVSLRRILTGVTVAF